MFHVKHFNVNNNVKQPFLKKVKKLVKKNENEANFVKISKKTCKNLEKNKKNIKKTKNIKLNKKLTKILSVRYNIMKLF